MAGTSAFQISVAKPVKTHPPIRKEAAATISPKEENACPTLLSLKCIAQSPTHPRQECPRPGHAP
jgi:hypothetical protein